MHKKYTRNAEKLRAWQSASRVERAPKREKKPIVDATKSNSSQSKPV